MIPSGWTGFSNLFLAMSLGSEDDGWEDSELCVTVTVVLDIGKDVGRGVEEEVVEREVEREEVPYSALISRS